MLHENSSPESLGIVRLGLYTVWLIELLQNPLSPLAEMPAEWFRPTGIYSLISNEAMRAILQPVVLNSLYATSIALALLAIAGLRPFTPIAVLAALCALLNDTLFKGFAGMVSHIQLGFLLSMWVIAPFPAADAMSVLGPRRPAARSSQYSAPIISMAAMLAVLYCAIAAYRLVKGKADIFFNDTILIYIGTQSLNYNVTDFRLGLTVLQHPMLGQMVKIGFFVTTIFELLSPLVLLSHRFRRVWLVFILIFHVNTVLMMNILFWQNMVLIFLIYTNLPHWFAVRKRSAEGLPVLFYDGQCGICNASVHWLMKRDTDYLFRYAPLQGDTARHRLPELPKDTNEWSVILQDEAGFHERSGAAIRAMARLGGLWTLAKALLIIPPFIRDGVYNYVARNRYRWIPRLEACPIPTPEERQLMLP